MHKRTTNDRGQVGIGTLLVFIAMVLIAAIAAGVLINTADFPRSSAEHTGRQDGEQASNRLQTNVATGTVNGTQIDEVNLTVNRAPGASAIDLDDVILSWTGPDGAHSLTDTEFTVGNIEGVGSDNVLDDQEDRAIISLDLSADSTPGELNEGETATIKITTASGGTTTVSLSVPQSLAGETAVEL